VRLQQPAHAHCARRSRALPGAAEHEAEAGSDEEDARQAWLLRVAAAVGRALDLLPSLATEAQLLALRGAAAPPGRQLQPAAPPPAELARGVADAAAALARSDRDRLRAGVFRPSHILPTMTIEQFGAQSPSAERGLRMSAMRMA
jgi:immunoglobulin-binding protein 1